MKTIQQILQAIRDGDYEDPSIDHRAYDRIGSYTPDADLGVINFGLRDGVTSRNVPELTEAAALEELAGDLAFAFEKATGKRGISANSMYYVIKMWMWVLDDPLADFDDYPNYGLPLFKAVALKYNLPNEIGDDTGKEAEYEG